MWGGLESALAADGAEVPFVSVVVVVRNEEKRIARCLAQITEQHYPKERIEIIVADGMSADETLAIIDSFQGKGVPIQAVQNPGLKIESGLNAAVRAAKGDVIVRLDARTVIGIDYLSRCVSTLLETGADNVGGIQKPIGTTRTQEAIGLAMSHPFGVGNAQFRLGKKSGLVDTLYLGCFRREVFKNVGLFDEDSLTISEDSDINHRIRKTGGKVYLNKDIVAYYDARETFLDFFKLYFQYGKRRAGNLLKDGYLTSWRQAVAPLFLGSLVLLPGLALADARFLTLFGGVLGLYLLVDLAVSVSLALRRRSLALLPRLLLAFPCMHLGWALGFWKRLLIADKPGTYWKH
jgi:glycosyltransferase involved in cell wall biosynthesis